MYHSKLPNLPTSIFAKMTQLAMQHDALNMSQGFPSFETDKKLKDLLARAIQEDHNQYAPMMGLLELRMKISKITKQLHGGFYDPQTEICLTAGATQGIYTAIQTVINKDDEAIIITPAYDCYAPAIKVAGGKVVEVPMEVPGFTIDWDRIKAVITSRTRLLILNSPHNPSGKLLTRDDWEQIKKVVLLNNLFLLSDEVYEHIIFDGNQHYSAAGLPELRERSFITGSFGKTFHVTGWKMGYCLAPKKLMDEFLKIHQNVVFCVNRPVQQAICDYLSDPSHYLKLGSFYQNKRDLFLNLIKSSKFKYVSSESTYFQLLDYSEITNESDIAFAERLTREYKIASIPISVFMDGKDPKMLRFCFAKKDQEIIKAAKIIESIV
ncbi:MAG: methionine aminotransferase [Nonlabens sp.]